MVNKELQNKQLTKGDKINATVSKTMAEDNGKKAQITLTEAKKKARNSATKSTNEIVKDIYQNVSNFLDFFFSKSSASEHNFT